MSYMRPSDDALFQALQKDAQNFGAEGIDGLEQQISTLDLPFRTRRELSARIEFEDVELRSAPSQSLADIEPSLQSEARQRLSMDWLVAASVSQDYIEGTGPIFAPFHADYQAGCRDCHEKGVVACGSCRGGGRKDCSARHCANGVIRCGCNGQGGICQRCNGHGHYWESRDYGGAFEKKQVFCGDCNSSGRFGPCIECLGTAGQRCEHCGGGGRVVCDQCAGQGALNCLPCHGTGQRHHRRTGRFVIEGHDHYSAHPESEFDTYYERLPGLIDASATRQNLENPQWEQHGDTGWIAGDRVARVSIACRAGGPVEIAASGSKEPAWRSVTYLNQLTRPVLEAFERGDYAKLRQTMAGTEILYRAAHPSAATPILDAYGLSQNLLPKIARMARASSKGATRGEWVFGLILGVIACVLARSWIDLSDQVFATLGWENLGFGPTSFAALVLPYGLMVPVLYLVGARRKRGLAGQGLRMAEVALPRLWPRFVAWIVFGYVIGTLWAAYIPWPFEHATCLPHSYSASLTTGECFDLLFRAPWRWIGLAPQTF